MHVSLFVSLSGAGARQRARGQVCLTVISFCTNAPVSSDNQTVYVCLQSLSVFNICCVVACVYVCIMYAHVEFESHISQVLAVRTNVLPCLKNIYRYMLLLGSIMPTLMTAQKRWTSCRTVHLFGCTEAALAFPNRVKCA